MEIKLKEKEILKEPVIISVDELIKYKDMMRVLVNFIYTAIIKGMESLYISDESSDNLKNSILGAIKNFIQPNLSEKTIRRAINGRYIITIKYIDGGTTEYSDDRAEFTIQEVSTE